MLVQPGDAFTADRLDRSLKTLYATGLFSDVNLRRDGNTLVVRVTENPIVNRITFEGNHKVTDDSFAHGRSAAAARGVHAGAGAGRPAAHPRRLRASAAGSPRRSSRRSSSWTQNRVNVVFEIDEGDETLDQPHRLRRQPRVRRRPAARGHQQPGEPLVALPVVADSYDADRIDFDKELLRRFYLSNGYADFEVTNASAELAPDKSAFFVTFTLNEGERYRVGKVAMNTTLPHLDAAPLQADRRDRAGRLVRRRRGRAQRSRRSTTRSSSAATRSST